MSGDQKWFFQEEPGVLAVNNACLRKNANGYTAFVHKSKEEEEVAWLTRLFGFPPTDIMYLGEDDDDASSS